MQNVSWPDKEPSGLSQIPNKFQPEILSNCSFPWSMINLFIRFSSYIARIPYFQETWYEIIGSCSWYSIFPYLQHTILTLLILINFNYETTSRHPIDIIYSRRHDPCHSKSDCVKRLYYPCLI